MISGDKAVNHFMLRERKIDHQIELILCAWIEWNEDVREVLASPVARNPSPRKSQAELARVHIFSLFLPACLPYFHIRRLGSGTEQSACRALVERFETLGSRNTYTLI